METGPELNYKISDFLYEFDRGFQILQVGEEVFRIKKINKIQEGYIYKNFEILANDLKKFVPTMYSLFHENLPKDAIYEKLKNAFYVSNDFVDWTFKSDEELKEMVEIKAANYFFDYIIRESGIAKDSIKDIINSSINETTDYMDNGDFFQLSAFMVVLKAIGYKMVEVNKLSAKEIVKLTIQETLMDSNPSYFVHIVDHLNSMYGTHVSGLFDLYFSFHPKTKTDVQELLTKKSSALNIHGKSTKEEMDKIKKSARIMKIDGKEINLDERDAVLRMIGVTP